MASRLHRHPAPVLSAILLLSILAPLGCRKAELPAKNESARRKADIVNAEDLLRPRPVGRPLEGRPWITQVNAVDLDRDGRGDLLVCDAKTNEITWLRHQPDGSFSEETLAAEIPGPVRAEPADMDGDGDLDILVASMGQVFPNNDKIGSVIILENTGNNTFLRRNIIEHVARVTDVRAGDFDGDGRPDLAVAQFGYVQGEIRWMRNLGDWRFESVILLNLPGAVNVCVGDLNGDAKPDIVALVSQQWEEIHLFEGDGRGGFSPKVIFGSTNEDFGSSGIVLCDLNRDGTPDILYTNGDGFDYAEPGSRPWHGVQWLENRGGGNFKYHRIANMPGAYSPVGIDLDEDGFMDVVAVSGFNEWQNPQAASLMWFRNDGRMNFTPHLLARRPTHLMTCTAGDLDGSGRPVLVTGAFHAYPPWSAMSRLTLWPRAKTP